MPTTRQKLRETTDRSAVRPLSLDAVPENSSAGSR
jgi:hypothetical protein